MARLKDGWNVHEQCGGKGCYRCLKRGYLIQCPVCATSDLEFFLEDEDQEITCLVCRFRFDRSGKVLIEPEKKVPLKPKKA